MFRALWWIWHRLVWSLRPLPTSTPAKDRILADRAWSTLRFHFRRAGTIRTCDPYAKPMKLDVDRPRVAMQGITRAVAILKGHSLPEHLMNALLRKLDPRAKEQASQQPEYQAIQRCTRAPGHDGPCNGWSCRETTPVDGSTAPPKSETP